MKKSDFYYDLPAELIAQKPLAERSSSRLLCLDKETDQLDDKQFTDFLELLNKEDCLVLNNTKVIPTKAPKTDAMSINNGNNCQPNQAPKTANNLKSPKPIPSLPVSNLNTQYKLHKLKYPKTAPIMASALLTKVELTLSIKPNHKSGRVSWSGNNILSKSINTMATNNQVKTTPATAAIPNPKCQATINDRSPVASSTRG